MFVRRMRNDGSAVQSIRYSAALMKGCCTHFGSSWHQSLQLSVTDSVAFRIESHAAYLETHLAFS